jgi:hypothetical protein
VGYHKDARESSYRKGGPLNEIGITIQVFQIAYVVITAIFGFSNFAVGTKKPPYSYKQQNLLLSP